MVSCWSGIRCGGDVVRGEFLGEVFEELVFAGLEAFQLFGDAGLDVEFEGFGTGGVGLWD